MEVCATGSAGAGGDVISAFAFAAGRGGSVKSPKTTWKSMTKTYFGTVAIIAICVSSLAARLAAQNGGELRFCLRMEPKTFDPLKVEDEASASIRYLTGGVLVRVNRQTQELEPELAQSWKISKDGRQITFHLGSGISFSDGTPFSAEDVAYTMQQLMDPALHSATGDAFRSGTGNLETKVISPTQITIT